ncbi:hypothetical protein LPJ64_000440 [Coemansia asiatica]|uniref:Uncharacterized protein n=1 Tax=Coemansia asiatica TaxID=1052880 RepID=A0A9W8CME3_9FUNG|nr:hypothetical protein LPJ64_000440 [Coemansia asiatica]
MQGRRRFTQTTKLESALFPLDKPSWAVTTLLSKPSNVKHSAELDRDLDQKEIARLYQLSGLKMADAAANPQEYTSVSKHVNQLRDLLSHIRTVSETGDLDSVQPLVRIAEPIRFTTEDDQTVELSFEKDSESYLGMRVLDIAMKKNGSYLIVED